MLLDKTPLLGEQVASNHWVVHGDHTATGMPMLASDPHLFNYIPCAWQLYVLELVPSKNTKTKESGRIVSGGQTPGAPAISIGRTNDIAWAFTTSRVDTSDLWHEKLNEDGT